VKTISIFSPSMPTIPLPGIIHARTHIEPSKYGILLLVKTRHYCTFVIIKTFLMQFKQRSFYLFFISLQFYALGTVRVSSNTPVYNKCVYEVTSYHIQVLLVLYNGLIYKAPLDGYFIEHTSVSINSLRSEIRLPFYTNSVTSSQRNPSVHYRQKLANSV
jgi:hypothetical protein